MTPSHSERGTLPTFRARRSSGSEIFSPVPLSLTDPDTVSHGEDPGGCQAEARICHSDTGSAVGPGSPFQVAPVTDTVESIF